MATCTVGECGQPTVGQGLCRKHYMRLRRKGSTDDQRKNARPKCSLGCDQPAVAFELCLKHYREQKPDGLTLFQEQRCDACGQAVVGRMRSGRRYCSARCKNRDMARRRDPEQARKWARNYRLKRLFGITSEAWDEMFAAQGKRCAICGTDAEPTKGWTTDHCHDAGHVRGILCNGCNAGLGHFKDNPAALRAAAEYLERGA
jgi:hypothetical protein